MDYKYDIIIAIIQKWITFAIQTYTHTKIEIKTNN